MTTNKRHAINRNKLGASVSVTKKRRRYKGSRASNKNIDQVIDYVVVGAGITGAYLARRLALKFPGKKILVLEREEHIGGRLESSTSTEAMDTKTKVVPEFGGMRLFPSIHPRAVRLLKLLKLATVEVPYVQANGIYYGREHRFANNALFPETELVYNVDDDEKGKDVMSLITDNIEKTLAQNKYTDNFDLSNRKALYQSDLSTLDFKETVINGANKISNENWIRFSEISGYAGLYDPHISFVSGAGELLALHSHDSTQYCVKYGYQQAPQKLLSTFSPTSCEKAADNNMRSNRNILFNVNLDKFEPNLDKTIKLQITDGNKRAYQVVAQNLYICTAANSVSTILGFPSNFIENIQNQLVPIPLFKIFLYYEKNWWGDLGGASGRSTTDLNINQLWFYNSNILMTYAVGGDATYWANKIPHAQQTEFIVGAPDTAELVAEIIGCYSRMFPEVGNIPPPNKIAWAYWNNGCSLWTAFDVNNFDRTPKTDVQRSLLYPLPQNENVCYLNNDISLNQGWVEGSIELVDDFLSEKFKMPNILSARL
jgi:hypothetical protein